MAATTTPHKRAPRKATPAKPSPAQAAAAEALQNGDLEFTFRGESFKIPAGLQDDPAFVLALSFGNLQELLPRLVPDMADQARLFTTIRPEDKPNENTEEWLRDFFGAFSEASGQGNS